MACQPGDATDVRLLVRQHERDADTAPTGTPRTPDAMDVAGVLGGRIEVDDVRDVDEIEAASGDVRRDERGRAPRLEARERALALTLAQVAVERDGVDLVELPAS